MDLMLELLWRGGPMVVMMLSVAVLAYWSIDQAERKSRRNP
jgi:hypothetical protein